MKSKIDKYKGISPGKIIARELGKLDISQRAFAASIGEHFQTLNAVITGRRKLTIELADKLDTAFGFEPGFLFLLQTYHEIDTFQKDKIAGTIKGVPNIRRILFWDTDFEKIDWGRSKSFVIERVMERGNKDEKAEIMRFYNLDQSALTNYIPANSYRIRAAK